MENTSERMHTIIKYKYNTYGPFKSKNLTIKDIFDKIRIPINGHYELYTYVKVDKNDRIRKIRKKIDINTNKYLESGIYIIEEKKKDYENHNSYSSNSYNSSSRSSYISNTSSELIPSEKGNHKKNLDNYNIAINRSNNSLNDETNSQKEKYYNNSKNSQEMNKSNSNVKLNSVHSTNSKIFEKKKASSSKLSSITSGSSIISKQNRRNKSSSLHSVISNISEQKKSYNNKSNSTFSISSNISEYRKKSSSKTSINSNINKQKNISSYPSSRCSIQLSRKSSDVSNNHENVKDGTNKRSKVCIFKYTTL